jgi:hypothetical protein
MGKRAGADLGVTLLSPAAETPQLVMPAMGASTTGGSTLMS